MGDGAVDTGLEIVSTFDWISPMLAIGGNLLHGGGYGLNIVLSSLPGSARDVQKILSKARISNWAPQIVGDTLMLNVKQDDAARACQILDSHGIITENPPPQTPRRAPKAHGRARQGGVFSMFDIFE